MAMYQDLPSDQIRVPQQGKPEAIFTWVRLTDSRIRLYASRNLRAQEWGQRTEAYGHGGNVDWHLGVTMREVLIVDKATAAEAITWVLERWAREDLAEAQRVERLRKHAIAGMNINDPKAITNLGGGNIL